MILERVFNLKTFTHSDTADRLKIDNTEMTDEELENGQRLHSLLVEVLDRIRTKHHLPDAQMKINSAYRSPKLNKAVGGVPTSQHCKFQSADTVITGLTTEDYFSDLKELAKAGTMKFGQVIKEHIGDSKWVHISLFVKDKFENQFMIKEQGKPYQHIEL